MMLLNRPPTEQEAKLQLIMSISRSQNAVARILDSLADISSYSEETAGLLAHEVHRMTRYQQAMASLLTGLQMHRQYTGVPAKPWINAGSATSIEQGIKEED
ncbi:hypothetical protein AWM70_14095 [Paenibacillus yonginensis]|uniref:Uncharacterized protein n=1 Tax=Paenibacillus yonginensis TaxID=1462996 RepID=A0A1B1N2E5_9BACL|nr:hypothetical protein [Paenibacillus yonginensis]ANS75589.1 hypothetical protein AWM70_14095 [Paenibacillus yonginensis]